MSDVVQKLWGFCHTLRHDGIDYGDYIEQITYLLFLKMADERSVELPKGCDWPKLRDQTGTELIDHYVDALRTLGKQPGILGDIYSDAQSRFNNPVNLKVCRFHHPGLHRALLHELAPREIRTTPRAC
jgi:type I restriction enzyme M protein